MRYIIAIVLLLTLVIGPQSCKIDACFNKTYFMSTYNNFMSDLQKNHKKFSEADWDSKDDKVNSFVNDCYPELEASMTGEEKINFWTKYVKYMILRHGSGALKEIEKEDKLSTVAIYDEIIDSVEDADLEAMLKDMYGDDIEKAVDDVLKEINKWGDQLKEWLNSRDK